MDLNSCLRLAVELGASDIHLKIGQPPILRRDGELAPMEGWAVLTEADLESALHMVGAGAPKRLEAFYDTGDLDVAYQDGDLPRFRVNAFRQRGAISFAFRVIPRIVPSYSDLNLPPGVQRLAEEHRGLILVTGATGSGKTTTLAAMIDHINRTRQAAHRHDRGPDRDPARRPRLHRQPARGRARHRGVPAGAPPRAAPGPGRDPDRRAARLRDGADRAPGGRVGPPRALDDAHDRRGRDDRPHDRVLPRGQAAADPLDHGRRAARRRQPAAAAATDRRPGRARSR